MPSWVVTGASRGLGYAWIAYLAADTNNTVIGIVRNVPATEERLAKDGITNVVLLGADVTDLKAMQAAADATSKHTDGKLDYLIHNAALVSDSHFFNNLADPNPAEVEADLMTYFKANVVGSAHAINVFVPLIRKGDVKKVIVMSTGLADGDLTNKFDLDVAVSYSVSKAASNMLVSKYHAALGRKEGILFLSLSPGMVDTREGVPLTETEAAGMQAMGARFVEFAPDFKGPITTLESVKAQLDIIGKATVATSGGEFVSHHGDKNWL